MLDPRIYRAACAAVVLAVIVFAFSLKNEPGGLHTGLSPQAFNGGAATVTMNSLAKRYPEVQPGSAQDTALATRIANGLGTALGRSSVSTQTATVPTIHGARAVETVTAVNPGLSQGAIVVVAPRDLGAGAGAISASAVLIQLAAVVHEQSLKHSIMFVSTSGSVGGGGIAQLARELTSQPVDAVIVLGDLAARWPSQPVIIPWSNSDTASPPALRNTLASALGAQAGVASRNSGVAAQVARLAFPMTLSPQAPLIGAGLPAVFVSLSGERRSTAAEQVASWRLGRTGQAMLQAIDALDAGQRIPPPTSYLAMSSKTVPFWAVRLLVLALLFPVLVVTIDGLARARRRGHTITRWAGWVLAGAVPFVLGLLVVKAAKYVSLIDVAPPQPVGAGVIPLGGSGLAVLIIVALVIVASFAFVRPALIHIAAYLSRERTAGEEQVHAGDCAGPALLLIASLVALVLWWRNPYTAALFVPALHLWIWVIDPEVRIRRPIKLLMLLIGLVPPALVIGYYVHIFGLSASDALWAGVLLIAGGQLGMLVALAFSVMLGCLVGAIVIAARPPGPRGRQAEVVTVRGPVTYAGPGSLGGTQSALRR